MAKKRRANGQGCIYKRKDGRWEAQATINDQRANFYAKTQTEVKEKLDTALDQARKGIYVKSAKTTFSDWLDFWLNEIAKPSIKPGTYDYYEYLIRIHIKPSLGKYPLEKLTIELLDQFYNRKLQEKKLRQKKQANGEPGEEVLSKKIVGDLRKVIGMALRKAVIKRKIAINPNEYTESIGKNEIEIEYLTPEEVADFLENISKDYWFPTFLIALGTGLRAGELAALKWGNVDLISGVLKVEISAARVNTYGTGDEAKTKLIIQSPKTKKSGRLVPLPSDVIKAFKDLQTRQQGNTNLSEKVIQFKKPSQIDKEAFVFTWPDGRMVDPNYLSKHFKKLVRKLELKNVHFHCLRHSYASMLLASGEDIKVISENLGHKDIRITLDMYTHVMDELRKRSARRLDGFSKKKKSV